MAFTQDISSPPPHAVRSEPLKAPARPRSGGDWAIGITLIVFGSLGWLSGARYTLFGWVTGLNMFLTWLGLPLTIPTPAGWWVLLALPLGVVYSQVERQIWTARSRHGRALVLFMIGWIIIVVTDVGSTYLGVRTPAEDAFTVTRTVANSAGLSFLWAVVLTFVSDWLILGSWKMLRR
jgi:hypothetical protein